MSALFWQSMTGSDGSVTVPSVGAVVGTISRWSLKRPEESSPGEPGLLTLRAEFSYVNRQLMGEDSIKKAVEITIRRGKNYRVCGERMAFDGATLVMEGCRLVEPGSDCS